MSDYPTLTPRTQAVIDGEFSEIRMTGLAQVLERELAVQTDLANHWRDVATKLKAGQPAGLEPVD
jgi:hypothetical protein